MTNFDPARLTRAETYGRLREWAERLKAFEGVPDMYRDIPSYSEALTADYNKLNLFSEDVGSGQAFLENHLDYLDSVRQKIQRTDPGYLKLQELVSKEYQNYPGGAFSVGLDPRSELNVFSKLVPESTNTFNMGLMAPAHEIYGHLRPYLLGIQPARDPVTVSGLRGSYKPNIISPTNEALAQSLNDSLIRNLGRSPENVDPEYWERLRTSRFPHHSTAFVGSRRGPNPNTSQVADLGAAADAFTNLQREANDIYTFPANALNTYVSSPAPEFTRQNPYFAPIVDQLRKSNYLSNLDFLDPLSIPEAARNSIARNLLEKYIAPSLSNFREGLRVSTPGWVRATDSPSAVSKDRNPLSDVGNLAAEKLNELTELDPDKQYSSTGMMIFGTDPVGGAARGLAQGIRSNPAGAAGGAAMTLLNEEVAKALAKDDYRTAATEAAKDVALGAAAETGLRQVAVPVAQRAAPAAAARVAPYVAGAARVGIPAAVGAGLFMQGRTGSALNTLTNKAAEVVPGLRANPQTDVGRRAGRAIANEGQYILNSILRNRIPYFKGRLF